MKPGQRSSIWSLTGLIAVCLIGVSLGLLFRLAGLEQKVFWVDEVATAIRIAGHTRTELTAILSDGQVRFPADLLAYQQLAPDQSLAQTFAALRQSPEHAPLYFLLLRFWAGLFGSSVVALRSFSVLCGLLLIGVMGWLGQALGQDLESDLGPKPEQDNHPGSEHPQSLPDAGTIGSGTSSRADSGTSSGPAKARRSQAQTSDQQTNAQITGYLAAGLTALSPLLIAYSQEARPYSLWLLLLALNSGLMLRALRFNRGWDWGLYGLTLVLSFYTSLLSTAVALGQLLYVVLVWPKQRRRFDWVWLGAGAALLPWLLLIGQSWQTLQHNTTWMRLPLGGPAKLATWFYTVAILYFDVPVITQPIWIAAATLICAITVVATIGLAFYRVFKITSQATSLLILTLAFSLPTTLIGLDLVINGRYSTAPRYWLPFHLGAQLAVALLLAATWNQNKPGWPSAKLSAGLGARLVAGFLVAVCLLSNLLHLETSPRYLKTRSLNNRAIAHVINQTVTHRTGQPLLLAEPQNTMDLLSLSHDLDPQTQIQILPKPALLNQIQQLTLCDRPVFLFNLSPDLQLQQTPGLTPAYQPPLLFPGEFALSLWRLTCP